MTELCIFNSDTRLSCAPLRAVVALNAIKCQVARSLASIEFNRVRNYDLSTPGIGIITDNSDVSGKQENFASHVKAAMSSAS